MNKIIKKTIYTVRKFNNRHYNDDVFLKQIIYPDMIVCYRRIKKNIDYDYRENYILVPVIDMTVSVLVLQQQVR